ncbi:chorismate mutase [Dysgonomonas sp. PH5-45]|uniref:bifunctional 3-deoxy-7-phosphoheptulonate synthase/chorismate mutase type II n=1 Tax=unclassified Dysgonomonas TaxID=2630389 RepID=UPI0024732DD5|nr:MULTISPECIES: bifunctional 3-deoxy-7-phosphoheptulonate synthase/chorismate mutase type II [unclassified Dysgonomonas]MDH6355174.1 chorismate mutase [Dysgonomonas sp. PH5-45]MDH6388100.1 chorismate mutase [Dysgonomonas sp. PH5-37]
MELESILLPGIPVQRPLVIAGPCSAETEEQVLLTAKALAAGGIKMFRAGVWKPRTKPGGFEGVGSQGLKWLKRVKQETGMYTLTEVATAKHADEALKQGIDTLWIGARTTTNPFAVQEIAEALRGVDIPVLVKNPVNPDLELWVGALERLNNVGLKRIGAIHRGFSSYNKKVVYRNSPHWNIPIELKRRYPQLPVISDPSHIGGRRDLIYLLAQQAMDMNFDGLMIEAHPDPENAWSDAAQQLTPDGLREVLLALVIRNGAVSDEKLSELRQQIDDLDSQMLELLARRMQVSQEIGIFKKEHGLTVVQNSRYNEILMKRMAQAREMGIRPEFVRMLLEAIHDESVRQQVEMMNRKE